MLSFGFTGANAPWRGSSLWREPLHYTLRIKQKTDREDLEMSEASLNSEKAFVLYLSGLGMSDISGLGEVERLMKSGVVVELEPEPIVSPQSLYYQLFSGRLPASFGFFDTLMPAHHLWRVPQGVLDYTIVEEHAGRDATPQTLDERLRLAGWDVEYEQTPLAELAVRIQALTSRQSRGASCKIVRCLIDRDQHGHAQTAIPESIGRAIDESLRHVQTWLGEDGLLVLLSDGQAAAVQRYVNVNNFLADVGLIERDEGSGLVNWPNSLAFFAGHGQLWVNLLGRDIQGAVHPQGEYEEVRETLVKALPTKLRDSETGATVVERVVRKEELYAGDYVFCAPDLVVLFQPGYAPSPSSLRLGFDKTTFSTPGAGTALRAGVHPSSVKGFLLARSPVLSSGLSFAGTASLTAVSPTLMHALGVEYVDMDSEALEELFLPSYLEARPIRASRRRGELSEEDEELIINRLRDLGYV